MIEVNNLSKRFRLNSRPGKPAVTARDPRETGDWFYAVRDVSFHCAAGEILGLLGPNGAGKTTTLRLLSTALKPDSGSARINDIDIVRAPLAARKALGFLSGTTGLYGRLTVRENIEYFARLHGMNTAEIAQRTEELFTLLDIHGFANKRADQLSTGMKQKCAIARAVVHRPTAVILDEPTTGLDVIAAKTLLEFIASYKVLRIPLIFSTHHLHEVEKLCDRVCIINHGKSVFNGTLHALREAGSSQGESRNLYDAFVQLIENGN